MPIMKSPQKRNRYRLVCKCTRLSFSKSKPPRHHHQLPHNTPTNSPSHTHIQKCKESYDINIYMCIYIYIFLQRQHDIYYILYRNVYNGREYDGGVYVCVSYPSSFFHSIKNRTHTHKHTYAHRERRPHTHTHRETRKMNF